MPLLRFQRTGRPPVEATLRLSDGLGLLLSFALLLATGCPALDSKVETTVPGGAAQWTQCGQLTFSAGHAPPYPYHHAANADALAPQVRDNLRWKHGLAGAELEKATAATVEELIETGEWTYGVAVKGEFVSHRDGNIFRCPCPRFVQFVRVRHTVTDLATGKEQHLGFRDHAAKTAWAMAGFKPTADGWCVDKPHYSDDPVYDDPANPGVLQWWEAGRTTMIDVPGVAHPWRLPELRGKAWDATYEFQTWLLAPCLHAGHLQEAALEELSLGPGHPMPVGLACETYPAQPRPALRQPVGHVRWSFELQLVVGENRGQTGAVVLDASYRWEDGPANETYRELMKENYPEWRPPPP